jgi:hypothetical protein
MRSLSHTSCSTTSPTHRALLDCQPTPELDGTLAPPQDGIVDGFFSLTEGFAAPALDRLLAKPGEPSERPRGRLNSR